MVSLITWLQTHTRQPALALDVSRYPITAVTPADCFHPSAAAHERLAAGVWNRLTMDLVGLQFAHR